MKKDQKKFSLMSKFFSYDDSWIKLLIEMKQFGNSSRVSLNNLIAFLK